MRRILSSAAAVVVVAGLSVGCDNRPANSGPPANVPAAPGPVSGTTETNKAGKANNNGLTPPPNIKQD